jgi:hypothetical protein
MGVEHHHLTSLEPNMENHLASIEPIALRRALRRLTARRPALWVRLLQELPVATDTLCRSRLGSVGR